MALSEPWPGTSGRAQARDIRNDLEGVVARTGIFPGSSTAPLLNKTSTMTPTIRAFDAAFRRTASDGTQLVSNDGPTGLFPAFDAAPASGARKDLLVLSVYDTAFDATAGAKFEIVKGDASTATDPAPRRDKMLANQMEIGTLTIPAGATSLASANVVWTETFQFAALRGAPVYFRKLQELRDAAVSSFVSGDTAFSLDTGNTFQLLNGTWNVLKRRVPRLFLDVPGASTWSLPGNRALTTLWTGTFDLEVPEIVRLVHESVFDPGSSNGAGSLYLYLNGSQIGPAHRLVTPGGNYSPYFLHLEDIALGAAGTNTFQLKLSTESASGSLYGNAPHYYVSST